MTKRRKTCEVMVGDVGVGGENPVRVQSMTTSSTRDVEATVEQIIRLADTGCEIARVTVQGIKEAEACEHIKNALTKKGYTIPLVADIHFYPPAAMHVVDFVDKVRVNPGNFVDRRATFKVLEYDDVTYAKEIEKIEEKFAPLVEKCKRLKRAMRIGTNHGSLSDRIMNRYGDTPQGMVESAIEFADVCRKYDYHDFIFSMKASNTLVMIEAYRLLVAAMDERGWDYPLHLGVTEAGQGEDGRIKSAIGIGTLLLDGLGDTIRVSLTEDPWYEIDPCKRLVSFAHSKEIESFTPPPPPRAVEFPKNISLHRDGTVYLRAVLSSSDLLSQIGCSNFQLRKDTADGIVLSSVPHNPEEQKLVQKLLQTGVGVACREKFPGTLPVKTVSECTLDAKFSNLPSPYVLVISDENEWGLIKKLNPSLLLFSPKKNRVTLGRQFSKWLQDNNIKTPVLLNFTYDCSLEDLFIQASAECGSLLCDGFGDGLFLEGPYETKTLRSLSFGILQGCRKRTFKTEFISCPSCGRTLFNLQEVSRRIEARTAHLPGVKIAIMGCIVNGPGEMADADFGYVGSRPGMIDLYVGKECVERNIPFEEGDERLIALIKSHDKWQEPV